MQMQLQQGNNVDMYEASNEGKRGRQQQIPKIDQ